MQPQGYTIEPQRGDEMLTRLHYFRCIILHVCYNNIPIEQMQATAIMKTLFYSLESCFFYNFFCAILNDDIMVIMSRTHDNS